MLKPILNIITAVSRENNLYFIQEELNKINSLEIRWHLIFDGTSMTSLKIPQDINFYHAEISNNDRKDYSGAVQKNIALSRVKEGWVYALDDDNIVHPNFPKTFIKAINNHPNKKAFVFSQTNFKNQVIIPSFLAKRTIEGIPFQNWAIDTAGYVVHYDLIKKTNARYLEFVHESDRHFWRHIVENCKDEIEFIDEIAAYHNALRYSRHPDDNLCHRPYNQYEKMMLLHNHNAKRPNPQFANAYKNTKL